MDYKQQMWEHHHHRYGLAGEGQADIIQRYLDRERGRVLDIGCGPWGEKVRNLAAHAELLVAADKSAEAVEMAMTSAGACPNVRFIVADARNLCLADGSIDHIVALGLFVYVPEGETLCVLSEFYRVCRAGGHLVLTNSVAHPREHYVDSARQAGFRMLEASEGYCPTASLRYLLIFAKK